jgi:hypothetical protein
MAQVFKVLIVLAGDYPDGKPLDLSYGCLETASRRERAPEKGERLIWFVSWDRYSGLYCATKALADTPENRKAASEAAKGGPDAGTAPGRPTPGVGAGAPAAGTRQASFQTFSAMMSGTRIGDRTITVQGDGNYTFEIKPHPQGAGGYQASYRLKAEHLAQLEQLLKATDWLAKPGAKSDPRIDDAVTYTLAVVRDGHKTEAVCGGDQPGDYAELIRCLERINRQEWLLYQLTAKPGDRSHAIHDIVSELDAIEGKPSTIKPYAPVLD